MVVTQAEIQKIVNTIVEASRPATVVVFGSYARGDARPDSDVDILVVERQVASKRQEQVRLQRLISSPRIPVDIIVTSEKVFAEWRDTPGTVLYQAAHEGRVLYEQAA